jgi:siroheme synthase (precorrin-2 oxidase/ferrochelatase)
VNDAVVREAHRLGALVQRVDGFDDEFPGDFITPAVHRAGTALILSVSTGGSPPLAALIRDRLAEQVDPIWPRLAETMLELRPRWLTGLPPAQRREVFHRAATAEAIEVFRAGGREALHRWLTQSADAPPQTENP